MRRRHFSRSRTRLPAPPSRTGPLNRAARRRAKFGGKRAPAGRWVVSGWVVELSKLLEDHGQPPLWGWLDRARGVTWVDEARAKAALRRYGRYRLAEPDSEAR